MANSPVRNTQVFWSSGIGDILAVEATFTEEYRRGITRMYWASRIQREMAPLFTRCPSYPALQDHVFLVDNFEDGKGYMDLDHAYSASVHRHLATGPIEDCSPIKRFDNPQPFTGSGFRKCQLAPTGHFHLPKQYAVICPYSTQAVHAVQSWRRFDSHDWSWTVDFLTKRNLKGVVLNLGHDPVLLADRIIDLSNRTSLAEAVEIVKRATCYIGIDTGFSVLAAQLLGHGDIVVRTTNPVLWRYRHVYYAPQTNFDFITPRLGATAEAKQVWVTWAESQDTNIFGQPK